MGEMDTILDEKKKTPLIVQGKTYEIGKLSALQVLRLARFMAQVATKSLDRLNKIRRDGGNPADDLLAIAEIFDEKELSEFVGILLKEDDPAILGDINAEELTELVAVIAERNDLGKLLGNVSRAADAIKRNLAKSKAPTKA